MIKVIICGIGGRMGNTMYSLINSNPDFKLICGIDKMADLINLDVPVYPSFDKIEGRADVIIDFSKPEALDELLAYAVNTGTNLVIATTGHSAEQLESIRAASKKTGIFMASNMSLGINLLTGLAKDAAKFLGPDYEIEIIEQHHDKKVDSPSGTALSLAKAVQSVRDFPSPLVFGRHSSNQRRTKNEIGVHAVRGGTIIGKHDVMFIGTGEVITLKHEAEGKEVFAQGAVRAAKFMCGKPHGMYDMSSILGSLYAVTTVTSEKDVTLITLPCIGADSIIKLLSALSDKNVNLDMISQTPVTGCAFSLSFTLPDNDADKAFNCLKAMNLGYEAVRNTCKITSEGAGMAHTGGVAKDVFEQLAGIGAKVFAVTTSETKISCCIEGAKGDEAEKALKKRFNV